MKIRAYITAYDRPEMLKQVVERFREYDIEPIIYEDGVTHPHRGKKGFWKTWDEILKDCKENEADLYIFTQDDHLDMDIERIIEYHKQMTEPYVFNLENDGRHQQWRLFPKLPPKDGIQRVGFSDCTFFCGRKTLDLFGYEMEEPPASWWQQSPNISSGVGWRFTVGFTKLKIPMYKPVKSLSYHGGHESKMHPEERKKNPLKSRH